MTYDLGLMSTHLDQNKIERMCEHYLFCKKVGKNLKHFMIL